MKERVKKINIFILIILFLAITNASSRFTNHGMTSLYRIISPFIASIFLGKYFKDLKKSFYIFLVLICYSIVVSLINYNVISISFYVHAMYIYICYILIKTYSLRVNNFEESFWKFLDNITKFSIFLCIIQFFIRKPYPNVKLVIEPGMNIFMGNENELGLAFGAMSLIYFYKFLKFKKNIIPFIFILIILYLNDAKITMLGCLFGFFLMIIYLKKIKIGKIEIGPRLYTALLSIVFFMVMYFLLSLDFKIQFRDDKLYLKDIMFTPIRSILTLTPLEGTEGSIVARINAIIYGLKELFNSKMLGIGLGNSIVMLKRPEYKLISAVSMHNLFFQILCELGILAIIIYLFIFKYIIKNIKSIYEKENIYLKLIFLITFFIISAQSSSGIFSNYYTWIIVFYIIILPENALKIQKEV